MATSSEYWRKREEENLAKNLKTEAEYAKEIQQTYNYAMDQVQKEIDSFYAKYADKEGITITEAKKRASKLDMEEYSRKAKKYVEEKNFSKQANEEMRIYNLTMKVNRLELLKANIGLELVGAFDELQRFYEQALTDRTLSEFERQAGILGASVPEDVANMADTIVNASFHNATYSQRIWAHQDLLKNELERLLTTGMVQGKNPKVLARELRKTFQSSVYNSERLMRTELARVQTAAQMQSYKNNEFTEYEYMACHNHDVCEICKALDGKTFKVEKAAPGENAPPMHPCCHCATTANMDFEAYEKWLDSYSEHGLSFREWQEAKNGRPSSAYFGKSLENAGKSSKMKTTKLANTKRRGVLPPAMDAARYKRMVSSLQKQGGSVIEAKGDDLAYLKALGAEATVSGTKTILHMGEIPSASAFFEEVIHLEQCRRYGEFISTDPHELYVREISANRKLLKYQKAYGFQKEDLEDIEANLARWEERFKNLTGVEFDESGIDREI